MHTRKFYLSFCFHFLQEQSMWSLNDSSPHPSAIYGWVWVKPGPCLENINLGTAAIISSHNLCLLTFTLLLKLFCMLIVYQHPSVTNIYAFIIYFSFETFEQQRLQTHDVDLELRLFRVLA